MNEMGAINEICFAFMMGMESAIGENAADGPH